MSHYSSEKISMNKGQINEVMDNIRAIDICDDAKEAIKELLMSLGYHALRYRNVNHTLVVTHADMQVKNGDRFKWLIAEEGKNELLCIKEATGNLSLIFIFDGRPLNIQRRPGSFDATLKDLVSAPENFERINQYENAN